MVEPFDAEAYVDQASRLVGVAIAPDHRPGVVENMATLARVADLVMDFPLPEDIEPAPMFNPLPSIVQHPSSKSLGSGSF